MNFCTHLHTRRHVSDVGDVVDASAWPWSEHRGAIVSTGQFARYLASAARDSAVVIDTKRRDVQCEWRDVTNGSVMLWVAP